MSRITSHIALAGLLAATAFTAAQAQSLTGNQSAIAGALTGVPTTATGVVVQNTLANTSTANLPATYSQFAPSGYAALPELTLRTAEFEEQAIRRYLRDYRAGGTGVNGVAGEATPGDRKYGSWLVGTGNFGHYDAATDRSRIDYNSVGVMGGLDLRTGKSLIGVTAGYNRADTHLDPNSPNSAIKSWFGGGYGTIGVGPLYVDGFGTYGEANYDLRRTVNIGQTTVAPTTLTYAGDTKSRTWLGGATTGLSFNFAGFEFEPFVGARYANLRINGFSDGNDVGAVSLGRRSNYESVLGNAGLRIGAAVDLGGGVSLRPEVRGAYRHEFLKDAANSFTFGFGGAGGTSALTFTPTALGRDYATAGAGFTVSGAKSPISFVVDYNGEYGKDRQVNGITGGVRMTF